MTCSKAKDAPVNDLSLCQNLMFYMEINQNIADSAMDAFKRHSWYLSEELVGLAIFSDLVDPLIQDKMISNIQKLSNQNYSRAQKLQNANLVTKNLSLDKFIAQQQQFS